MATDQSTFHEKLKFRLAMYNLREVDLRVLYVRAQGSDYRGGRSVISNQLHSESWFRRCSMRSALGLILSSLSSLAWERYFFARSDSIRSKLDIFRFQDNKPYLFSSDFFGAPMVPDMDTNGFVVAGTCTEQLYGMCESMWRQGKIAAPI